MSRLLLVRHASTPATRRAAFPLDEPLDPPGIRHARELGRFLTRADRAFIGPAACDRQTAAEAGLEGEVDSDLAGWDYGRWAGRSMEEVERQDPAGFAAWQRDPNARPPGGESLVELVGRARTLIGRMGLLPGRTALVTDAGLIRAAVVAALDAPLGLFWSIDISPASITELATRHHGPGDAAVPDWRLLRSNWTPPVPE